MMRFETKKKKDLKYQLTQSNKLEICLHLIRDFELINVKRKFVSDLKKYIYLNLN